MFRVLRRALLAALIPLAAVGLAACGGSDMPGMAHGSNPTPGISAGAGFNAADVEFAQMMIAHHRQAVEMSNLAATRAADPEVKQLSAAIVQAQVPEITTMIGWLDEWKQPTGQPSGHNMAGMPGMMSDQDMAGLAAASGVAFDRKYTQLMIAHHQGALQMAGEVLADGTSPDVKTLAQAVVSTQTAEIGQLQKILARL